MHWIEESIRSGAAVFNQDGALMTKTGTHTGRAVKDRYLVMTAASDAKIAWNQNNHAMDEAKAAEVFTKAREALARKVTHVYLGYVGPYTVRVTTPSAWHALFASNMFRDTPSAHVPGKAVAIEIFHLPFTTTSELGLNWSSETLIAVDLEAARVVIIGTAYAGEIKKSAFTVCNYWLPEVGVLPMHASANSLPDGSKASVLFGLSGTGKTTLSAAADRALLGDDEIVWSDEGLSNLEGGCYAKLIDLTAEREPEIYRAISRFGAILENVDYDAHSRKINFASRAITENTRGSYPLSHLDGIRQGLASHPETIVFLTADAYGALPAVARLNSDQARYYFLSGYTARVAGTELGVKEPQATFSTCFGAPFMPRHNRVYADLLAKRIEKYKSSVWLLNTGWMAGGYGHAERFPLKASRQILSAIQNGTLARERTVKHPVFGFEVPVSCHGLNDSLLAPPSGDAVKTVASKFVENAHKWPGMESSWLQSVGPAL